jgi:hypothetical protein
MARKTKKESDFEADFMERLDSEMPEPGFWIKGNSAMRQGVPDRMYLNGPHWAALEFKKDSKAPPEPNQPYYVEKLGKMSYASFVTPENADEVISGIREAFGAEG